MLSRERLTPTTVQMGARSLGERQPFPRYRHPESGITIVDVRREVNPEKTNLIPISANGVQANK